MYALLLPMPNQSPFCPSAPYYMYRGQLMANVPTTAGGALPVVQESLDDGFGHVWTNTPADQCRNLVVKYRAMTSTETGQEEGEET